MNYVIYHNIAFLLENLNSCHIQPEEVTRAIPRRAAKLNRKWRNIECLLGNVFGFIKNILERNNYGIYQLAT